jgi:hypothetical protein
MALPLTIARQERKNEGGRQMRRGRRTPLSKNLPAAYAPICADAKACPAISSNSPLLPTHLTLWHTQARTHYMQNTLLQRAKYHLNASTERTQKWCPQNHHGFGIPLQATLLLGSLGTVVHFSHQGAFPMILRFRLGYHKSSLRNAFILLRPTCSPTGLPYVIAMTPSPPARGIQAWRALLLHYPRTASELRSVSLL